MFKKFIPLLLMVIFSSPLFAFAEDLGVPIFVEEAIEANAFDGIWLAESGQFFTINQNDGALVVVQLDDKLYGSPDRLWVAYIGEITGDRATLQTMEGFADGHATLDMHFLRGGNDVRLIFSFCEDFSPTCEHSPPVEVMATKIW